MRHGELQRVVVGVGHAGEGLEIGGGDPEERRAGAGVFGGAVCDYALGPGAFRAVAIRAVNRDRVGGSGFLRLVRIESCAEMGALGADVADFGEPVVSEFALNGEVPLLSGCSDPVLRNLQLDQAVDVTGKTGSALLRKRGRVAVAQCAARGR